jgi:hypothetical protein
LRPLGSIKAPSFVVRPGYVARSQSGKKEEMKAAALAAAELGITVEELAELKGRIAPELSPTEDWPAPQPRRTLAAR